MRGRPILALVFVTLVALALTIPLRNTGDDQGSRRADKDRSAAQPTPEETPAPSPASTPTPEETPTPEKTPEPEEPPDTATFAGEYPQECLNNVGPPTDDGLIAIDQGSRISISDLGGSETGSIKDAFPLAWSSSGEYLMAESGTIYDQSGAEVASLLNEDTTSYWGWSPIADCMLTTDGTAMSVFVPDQGRVTLHSGALTSFAFSPAGRSLAYLEEDEAAGQVHLWMARLGRGEATRLTTLELADEEQVVLAGWTPDARHVLFWQASPEELLDPGARLQAVSAGGRVTKLPVVLAHSDFLAACNDDLFGIVGAGSRSVAGPKRLALLEVGGGTNVLTPEGSQDISVDCSPAGGFAATIRTPEAEGRGAGVLTVIETDGTEVLSADDDGFRDAHPLWGRAGAGLLFIRRPLEGGDPVLWHVAEGGSPAPTGITLRNVDDQPGTLPDAWGHWLAWSAHQPNGVSSTSGP